MTRPEWQDNRDGNLSTLLADNPRKLIDVQLVNGRVYTTCGVCLSVEVKQQIRKFRDYIPDQRQGEL